MPNIKILYLHAREIVERLSDGSLDLGFSGLWFIKRKWNQYSKKNKCN